MGDGPSGSLQKVLPKVLLWLIFHSKADFQEGGLSERAKLAYSDQIKHKKALEYVSGTPWTALQLPVKTQEAGVKCYCHLLSFTNIQVYLDRKRERHIELCKEIVCFGIQRGIVGRVIPER